MQRQITLEQNIQTAMDGLKASLYLSMPGAITAYDATTMTASVQPMLNDPRTNLDTDGVDMEPWPILHNVGVAWPRFGGFVLCGPLNVGDPVTLEAWDLDPSAVFKQGAGSIKPVDPIDVRRLSGNYWRATPDNLAAAIKDAAAAAAALLLGLDGDQAQIRISAGKLQLGATGGDFVALASKVLAELNSIKSAFSGHTHTVTGGGGVGTPQTTSAAPTYAPSSVASSLIGAQ